MHPCKAVTTSPVISAIIIAYLNCDFKPINSDWRMRYFFIRRLKTALAEESAAGKVSMHRVITKNAGLGTAHIPVSLLNLTLASNYSTYTTWGPIKCCICVIFRPWMHTTFFFSRKWPSPSNGCSVGHNIVNHSHVWNVDWLLFTIPLCQQIPIFTIISFGGVGVGVRFKHPAICQ